MEGEPKPDEAKEEEKKADNEPINIKIKDSQGEVYFRVKMSTKFAKVRGGKKKLSIRMQRQRERERERESALKQTMARLREADSILGDAHSVL